MGKKTTAATTTGKRHSKVALACKRKSSKKKRIRTKAEKKCEQQFRSNMNGVIKVVQDLQLTSSQTYFLSEFCPFWNLIKVIIDKKVTKQSTTKNYVDIANIVSCFDKESKSFHFAGNELWFTREDLVNVFGISGGKDPILLDTSRCKHVDKCVDSTFYKMNFKDVTRLTTGIVLRKLKRTAAKGTSREDCINLCQLMTLYFVTALFDPTKGSTLTWGYNKYVMVLSEIKKYDWAGYFYEKLHSSLCNYKIPQDVTGCIMALPFWIMENFEETAPRHPDAELLCEKWDLTKLKVPLTQVLEIQREETLTIPCLNSTADEIEGLDEGRKKDNELMIVESVNADDAYWFSPLSTHVKILKEKINRNKRKNIVKESEDNDEETTDKVSKQLKKLEGLKGCQYSGKENPDCVEETVDQRIEVLNSRVAQLQADLCLKDAEISVLKNKEAEFNEMKAEYQRKDAKILQLEADVAQKDDTLHEEISVWKNKEAEFNEMKAEYQRKYAKILQLEADVAQKDTALHEEKSVWKKKEAEFNETKAILEEESRRKDVKLLQLEADMAQKDATLCEEISVLKKKEAEFNEMKAILEEESRRKDAKILQLEADMVQKEERPFMKFFANN